MTCITQFNIRTPDDLLVRTKLGTGVQVAIHTLAGNNFLASMNNA